MKVENFAAAVEFYSKAIALNPQNAVYYCNRWARTRSNRITSSPVLTHVLLSFQGCGIQQAGELRRRRAGL